MAEHEMDPKTSEKRKGGTDLETSKEKEHKMDLESSKEKKPKMDLRVPRKRAVLIGLNHPDPEKMKGIDVKGMLLKMKKHLTSRRGFPARNVTLMIQDEEDAIEHLIPTSKNIPALLHEQVAFAKPGDILFFHLIAYGCSDACIVAADRKHVGDVFFRAMIYLASKKGCHLTFVSDCLIEPNDDCNCLPLPTPKPEIVKTTSSDQERKTPRLVFGIIRGITQTTLSSVDLNSKEEELTENSSSLPKSPPVVLLTPFQCDRQALMECKCKFSQEAEAEFDIVADIKKYLDPPHKRTTPQTTTPPPPLQRYPLPFNFWTELFLPPPKGTTTQQTYGGLTNAILEIIDDNHGEVTNLKLAQEAMKRLGTMPGLSCNHHRDATESFVC